MRIVIVDDNKKAAADLINRLGNYAGAQVVGTASNGFDGLETLLSAKPDVLFLDVELPDISGLDFLARSTYLQSGKCRVVIYTSYDKYVLPALRNQAFDVLLKPIDAADLDGVMDRLLHSIASGEQAAQAAAANPTGDKFLLYTNSVDFTLVNKQDIGFFQYDQDARCWEAVVTGHEHPIRLRRNTHAEDLLQLGGTFVQVSQKHIVNLNYLAEVVNSQCRFFPPFDKVDHITVGRIYRKRLTESFLNL